MFLQDQRIRHPNDLEDRACFSGDATLQERLTQERLTRTYRYLAGAVGAALRERRFSVIEGAAGRRNQLSKSVMRVKSCDASRWRRAYVPKALHQCSHS